jgi:hypothetical protein
LKNCPPNLAILAIMTARYFCRVATMNNLIASAFGAGPKLVVALQLSHWKTQDAHIGFLFTGPKLTGSTFIFPPHPQVSFFILTSPKGGL